MKEIIKELRKRMKRKIFTVGLIYSLIISFALSAEKKNISYSYEELFPDLVERMYIIMKDGKIFKHSTLEQTRISLNAWMLKKALKQMQYKVEDILIIIHNHRFKRKFSTGDWTFYSSLKRYGFSGRFLHYCHQTKEVYDIEKKSKGKQ